MAVVGLELFGHLLPTGDDTPTDSAASSLESPLAIPIQNG
jgi:hypothetical protein